MHLSGTCGGRKVCAFRIGWRDSISYPDARPPARLGRNDQSLESLLAKSRRGPEGAAVIETTFAELEPLGHPRSSSLRDQTSPTTYDEIIDVGPGSHAPSGVNQISMPWHN